MQDWRNAAHAMQRITCSAVVAAMLYGPCGFTMASSILWPRRKPNPSTGWHPRHYVGASEDQRTCQILLISETGASQQHGDFTLLRLFFILFYRFLVCLIIRTNDVFSCNEVPFYDSITKLRFWGHRVPKTGEFTPWIGIFQLKRTIFRLP